MACPGSSWQSLELVSIRGQFLWTWGCMGMGPRVTCQREEAGLSCCLCPLVTCMGFRDGPGFALQNSKPDSLLKMEEEQKLEKSPLSGNKDTKFSFSFSNKKLLGYVSACARRGWLYTYHMSHTHTLSVPSPHHTHTCPACAHLTHTHTLSWRTLQVSPCPELEDVARHTPHEGLTRLTPFLLPKPKSSGR